MRCYMFVTVKIKMAYDVSSDTVPNDHDRLILLLLQPIYGPLSGK